MESSSYFLAKEWTDHAVIQIENNMRKDGRKDDEISASVWQWCYSTFL
jgi:hypothetical protein